MIKNHKKLIRFFLWVSFIVYLALLVYFLFLSEGLGRGSASEYRYNITPFKEIKRYLINWRIIGLYYVFLNIAGNVICFMPFGFIVPVLFSSQRNLWKVGLLSAASSTMVETIQLLSRVGCCDVDDIILNTLGGIMGYICYKITLRIISRK